MGMAGPLETKHLDILEDLSAQSRFVFVTLWLSRSDSRGFTGALVVKNQPADAGDTGDMGSIPGSGRSPGGGNGNPLQYSCLENLMDRGAWWTPVTEVTNSRTWLRMLAHVQIRRWLSIALKIEYFTTAQKSLDGLLSTKLTRLPPILCTNHFKRPDGLCSL